LLLANAVILDAAGSRCSLTALIVKRSQQNAIRYTAAAESFFRSNETTHVA
jgi:hypothetical protein